MSSQRASAEAERRPDQGPDERLGAQLYEQLIQDHARRRVGLATEEDLADVPELPELPDDSARSQPGTSVQYNPVCGDRITLHTALSDGRLRSIRWTGQGCALSQASASMIVERFAGRDLAGFQHAAEHLRAVLRDPDSVTPDEDVLGDAIALSGVARLPARVKCVMLAWVALEDAISTLG